LKKTIAHDWQANGQRWLCDRPYARRSNDAGKVRPARIGGIAGEDRDMGQNTGRESSIRVHIEVTYNGVMVARDDEQRFIASARRYKDLRVQVREGLRALHGAEVAFALMVGSPPRGPRVERNKAVVVKREAAVAGTARH
jgi:hypothetical protein